MHREVRPHNRARTAKVRGGLPAAGSLVRGDRQQAVDQRRRLQSRVRRARAASGGSSMNRSG